MVKDRSNFPNFLMKKNIMGPINIDTKAMTNQTWRPERQESFLTRESLPIESLVSFIMSTMYYTYLHLERSDQASGAGSPLIFHQNCPCVSAKKPWVIHRWHPFRYDWVESNSDIRLLIGKVWMESVKRMMMTIPTFQKAHPALQKANGTCVIGQAFCHRLIRNCSISHQNSITGIIRDDQPIIAVIVQAFDQLISQEIERSAKGKSSNPILIYGGAMVPKLPLHLKKERRCLKGQRPKLLKISLPPQWQCLEFHRGWASKEWPFWIFKSFHSPPWMSGKWFRLDNKSIVRVVIE